MKRILAGTAVAGMLFVNHACMNRNVNAMREEIDKLKRGTISLPLMQMKCIHQDLWHDASEKRPLKLVVYSDSSACSSCAVSQLYTWIDLMRESEPYQGKFGYHFIFCPKTNDKANVELAIMALQHFKHPVFIDTANVFERSNPHLPHNPLFHTFLLDEDNRVVLVGNPLENEKIEELFWKIVKERLGERH